VVYGSFRDITGRVQMEEEAKIQQAQLIHANRMASLGTIVSSVAHEVNNPNNLVMFNAPMILSAWDDAVPVLEAYFRENGDFSLGGLPYSEMRRWPGLAAGISNAWPGSDDRRPDYARHEEPRKVTAGRRERRADCLVHPEPRDPQATHRFELSARRLPPVLGSAQQLSIRSTREQRS
jgi:hypothetical protein